MSDTDLKTEIERAALGLLTDEEICVSLNITAAKLRQHYDVINAARLKLKQKLNARRISDAASGQGNIDKLLGSIPVKKPHHMVGKVHNPRGKPRGTTNKISGQSILEAIAARDVPFHEGLAEDYARARQESDRHLVVKYQQMILNKVVADKSQIDLDMNTDRMVDEILTRLTIGKPHDQA